MKPVYFFGRLSALEAVGPDSPTDSDSFRRQLADRFPELADPRVRMAVNQTMVSACVPVNPEDEVAFLPPMSGG